MEFKDLIVKLRTEMGKSQSDIAHETGVYRSTVLRWERGDIKNMKRDKLVALAKALNVDPAVLMSSMPVVPEAAPTRDSVATKLEAVLRQAGYLLPGEQLTPELLSSISVALETAIEIYRKNHK